MSEEELNRTNVSTDVKTHSHIQDYSKLVSDDDQMLIAWPPRSPDATPCNFFLWGYVKDQVYVPPLPSSIPELKVRIRTAIETTTPDMLQTVWNELDYLVDVCRITKGAHTEHL